MSLNAPGQSNSANQINPVVHILRGHDPNTPYFDGNPPNGVLGSTGKDILRGAGFFSLNASVTRIFSIKEDKLKFPIQPALFAGRRLLAVLDGGKPI